MSLLSDKQKISSDHPTSWRSPCAERKLFRVALGLRPISSRDMAQCDLIGGVSEEAAAAAAAAVPQAVELANLLIHSESSATIKLGSAANFSKLHHQSCAFRAGTGFKAAEHINYNINEMT
ncbi:hypothetical protein RB195_008680 [Necator americanus]|uniref:Uncharacterized protein n=2 Tax=Necator americanus TaxID=51031 RepID=A0ABR1CQM4_NECAM